VEDLALQFTVQNAPTPTPRATPTSTPIALAYGQSNYTLLSSISISPTSGIGSASVIMTCSVTGADCSAVRLRYEGPEVVTFAANEDERHGCSDSSGANLIGTYSWIHIEVVSSDYRSLKATYLPGGTITDYLGNVVGTHSFSPREIEITDNPTPTPTLTPDGKIAFSSQETATLRSTS
jgi:hypothetical protein